MGKILRIVALLALGAAAVRADLPSLMDKKWLGYFVGVENKRCQFALTAKGRATLRLMGEKGEPITKKLWVNVDFIVEESLPGGRVSQHFVLPDTLVSQQKPTETPENIVIRGQVRGGASFEATLHEDRGTFHLGGRLLDPGPLAKNPIKFLIRLKFPNAYPSRKTAGDKAAQKRHEDQIKDDRVQLLLKDGTKMRLSTAEDVSADLRKAGNTGIAAARIEFSGYKDQRIELSTSPESRLTPSAAGTAPLQDGFTLDWSADPAKNPDGKEYLVLEVK